MVFSSLVFLFLFLPICIFSYFIVGKRFRNLLLLMLSLIFYAWGEGSYVLIMLVCIGFNFLYGRILPKIRDRNIAPAFLVMALLINLGLLVFYKYTNFFVRSINPLLITTGIPALQVNPIHLPIGISFFTFQAITYVVDVYKKKAPPQKRISDLGLYISLFPQLIAGPIIRYNDIARQISSRVINMEGFAWGIKRFIMGLGKKVLIANNLAWVADDIFRLSPSELTTPLAWLGIICYSFQIYFDFSGYSDMAIGIGRMLGFEFLENFNYPYISKSIQEFWRRWHISLSNWFRDYLYIPLGGNQRGNLRTYFNLYLVFFLCGLWHGASWNFILWGLLHGSFLVLERLGLKNMLERTNPVIRYTYVFLVVTIGWVFFRSDTISQAFQYLSAMFGFSHGSGVLHPLGIFLSTEIIIVSVFAIFASTPFLQHLKEFIFRLNPESNQNIILISKTAWETLALILLVLIFLLSTTYLAVGSYNPFIYFRF